MSLISNFEKREEVLLVRLIGELDHHEAERLKEEWKQQLSDQSIKHVVVNLEELAFMDSSGLGVFLGRYKEVKQLDGEMVICSYNQSVKRLFELSGLFKLVRTASDEEAALARLGVAS
ncbi:anti-sigma F factor antagonist [Tenuibacillus multivorans]|uniref:Anti-sigma F factor antagonist n=1 Tax=Tenuibacillus multivorans TaxID=237069 RepID=A0A1H0CZP6_9BACI|nr:anti-sigma F factor antagonist [Tenuibacillus multivorans]GEL76101.1 anti-sigma F factor antagonist [Tenuibacillus multivorans]SDN63372.1 stage II sporulation protein AA (anti-sigma F factor antagonist) [Tenuibacillus multivorans]